MHLQPLLRTRRRPITISLCYLIMLQMGLQIFTIAPVNADLDFMTKLKLIGLLALSKKIQVVPIPIPIPFEVHLEGKDEVVYLKAPPPVSRAYSYSPMAEYSHVRPRYVRPPKPSSAHYLGHHKAHHHDAVGHASEIVPIVAESAPRYGERILPGSTAPSSSAPSPKPIHRHRTHRTRIVARPKIQSSVEYYQPSTTAAPPLSSLAEDYYQTPYQPEVTRPQVESIAIVPVKTEVADTSEPVSPQLQSSSDGALPENLLNYIRQVQGLTDKSQKEANNKPVGNLESPQPSLTSVGESDAHENTDKWQPNGRNNTDNNVPSSSRPSEQPESVSLLTHNPPQQQSFISIENKQNVPSFTLTRPETSILTPIHSQWQQHFPSAGSSSASHYQTSDYVYRPPELKVMHNLPRYNPSLDQPRPSVNPSISSLRQSFTSRENANHAAQSFANSAPVPPQQTQFIYSVTHSNPPSNPFGFSPPIQYPNSDNFGLSSFQKSQSQQKNGQSETSLKPAAYLPSLNAAASAESAKWIKPVEKGAKSKFFNNFGHRLSQLF